MTEARRRDQGKRLRVPTTRLLPLGGVWIGALLLILTSNGTGRASGELVPRTRPLNYERARALVVGVTGYDSGFENIGGPAADAAGVARLLAARFGFDVELLLDQAWPENVPGPEPLVRGSLQIVQATSLSRDKILGALRGLSARGDEIDRDALVFFFAGHGVHSVPGEDRLGFLVPSNGRADDAKTLLALSDVASELETGRARHTLLLLDACFSGVVFNARSGVADAIGAAAGGRYDELSPLPTTADRLTRMFSRPAFQALTAAEGDEAAADQAAASATYLRRDPRAARALGVHSPFTGALLGALRGRVGGSDGRVLASDLGYQVRRMLVDERRLRNAQQTPRYGVFAGLGDMVLAPVRPVLDPTRLSPLYREGEDYASLRAAACAALLDAGEREDADLVRDALVEATRLLRDPDPEPRASAAELIADLAMRHPALQSALAPVLDALSERLVTPIAEGGDAGLAERIRGGAGSALTAWIRHVEDPATLAALAGRVRDMADRWDAFLVREALLPAALPPDIARQHDRGGRLLGDLGQKDQLSEAYRVFASLLNAAAGDALRAAIRAHQRAEQFSSRGFALVGTGDFHGGAVWLAEALYAAPHVIGHRERLGAILALAPRLVAAFSTEQQTNWTLELGPDKRVVIGMTNDVARAWRFPSGEALTPKLEVRNAQVDGFNPPRVVGVRDKVLGVWDLTSGTCAAELTRLGRLEDLFVYEGQRSPDGSRLALRMFVSKERTFRLVDLTTRRTILELPPSPEIARSAFGKGGQLVTAAMDGSVRVWDARTGLPLGPTIPTAAKQYASPHLGPLGQRLIVSGISENALQLFDARSGNRIALLDHEHVTRYAFSPSGKRVATVGGRGSVRVWDLRTGARVREVVHEGGRAFDSSFSPDERVLATTGEDKFVRLIDLETGGNTMLHHSVGAADVRFAGDGILTVGGGWGHVYAWKLGGPEVYPPPVAVEKYHLLSLTPDGSRAILVQGESRQIYSWAPNADEPPQSWTLPAGERIHAIGKRRRCAITVGKLGWPQDEARVWNLTLGQPKGPKIRHPFMERAQLSPGESRLITMSSSIRGRQGWVRVWDVSGALVLEERVRGRGATAIISADDTELVVLEDERPGQRRASVWDLSTRTRVAELGGFVGGASDGRLGPGARALVLGLGTSQLQLWDWTARRPIQAELFHYEPIHDLTFGPHGQLVASVSLDRTARVWDAASGAAVTPALKHAGPVFGLRFGPHGRRVATRSGAAAQVWNAFTGRPITPPLEHGALIADVVFAPGGNALITLDAEGRWHRWSLAPALGSPEELRALCRIQAMRTVDAQRGLIPLFRVPQAFRELAR